MIFVPPDAAYFDYIDLRTLALLYCLMAVVSGIRKAGTFAGLAHTLFLKVHTTRSLAAVLVGLCFFSAMFITNDVALLTFVPFAVVVLGMAHREKMLLRVVVLQTAAANLGSMLTPVGNPQNLYIQSHYGLGTAEFLRITLPVWLASLLLLGMLCFLVPSETPELFLGEAPRVNKKKLWFFLALFAVCLLCVLRLLPWPVMLGVVIVALAVFDRGAMKDADFLLLLTFVCFFIFSGNLARIPAVDTLLRRILTGREYWISLAASQVISNVPAALLLSGFTDNAKALLLGVDIGGLGTPIASLASLIGLKLYSHSGNAETGKFLLEFTWMNLLLLAILSLLKVLILK